MNTTGRFVGACLAFGALCAFALLSLAQSDADFAGDWNLTLEYGGAVHSGVLEIEAAAGALQAFVDGDDEPIP